MQTITSIILLYENGAEPATTSEGKIIDTQLYYLPDRLCWQCHDAPEKSVPRELYPIPRSVTRTPSLPPVARPMICTI